jgi:hypothetical protein
VAIFEIDEARGYDPTRSTAGGFQLLPSPTPRTKPQISGSTYQQPRFGNRRFVRKFYGSPRSSATAIVFSGGSAWGGCGVAAQIRLGQRHDGRRWRAWVRTWSGRSRKQECSCP